MKLWGSSHVNLHLNAILPWGKEWDYAYVIIFLTDYQQNLSQIGRSAQCVEVKFVGGMQMTPA
jgi:hypothetical protein